MPKLFFWVIILAVVSLSQWHDAAKQTREGWALRCDYCH